MKGEALTDILHRRNHALWEYSKDLIALQLKCEHKRIVEAPYSSDSVCISASPDFRVCLDCGFAEEGWGCGYQILSGVTAPIKVTREKGMGLATTELFRNCLFVTKYRWSEGKRDLYEMAVRGTIHAFYKKREEEEES